MVSQLPLSQAAIYSQSGGDSQGLYPNILNSPTEFQSSMPSGVTQRNYFEYNYSSAPAQQGGQVAIGTIALAYGNVDAVYFVVGGMAVVLVFALFGNQERAKLHGRARGRQNINMKKGRR